MKTMLPIYYDHSCSYCLYWYHATVGLYPCGSLENPILNFSSTHFGKLDATRVSIMTSDQCATTNAEG